MALLAPLLVGISLYAQAQLETSVVTKRKQLEGWTGNVPADFAMYESTITVRNTSNKTITALTVQEHIFLADGTEQQPSPKHGQDGISLAPGKTSIECQCSYTGPKIARITVEPVVIIYDDNTAQVKDEEAFEAIVKGRKAALAGTRHALEIMDKAFAEDIGEHPSVKVLAAFDEALQDDPENIYLKAERDSVAKVQGNPKFSERFILEVNRANLREDVAMLATSVDIREVPWSGSPD
jgi:hypothetical protein